MSTTNTTTNTTANTTKNTAEKVDMGDLMKLIQEADGAAIELERARFAVEAAKQALENAKENFDQARVGFEQVLAKADDVGVPRAKIKKLIEDRTSALVASGLIVAAPSEERAKSNRVAKVPKKATKVDAGPAPLEDAPPVSEAELQVFDAESDETVAAMEM